MRFGCSNNAHRKKIEAFLAYGGYWLWARSLNGNVLPLACSACWFPMFPNSRVPSSFLDEKNKGCSRMKLEMGTYFSSCKFTLHAILLGIKHIQRLSHNHTTTWENNCGLHCFATNQCFKIMIAINRISNGNFLHVLKFQKYSCNKFLFQLCVHYLSNCFYLILFIIPHIGTHNVEITKSYFVIKKEQAQCGECK